MSQDNRCSGSLSIGQRSIELSGEMRGNAIPLELTNQASVVTVELLETIGKKLYVEAYCLILDRCCE